MREKPLSGLIKSINPLTKEHKYMEAKELVSLIISNTASQFSGEWKPDKVYSKDELIEIVDSYSKSCALPVDTSTPREVKDAEEIAERIIMGISEAKPPVIFDWNEQENKIMKQIIIPLLESYSKSLPPLRGVDITDEEIEKEIEISYPKNSLDNLDEHYREGKVLGFKEGARWLRDQIASTNEKDKKHYKSWGGNDASEY